MQKAAVSLSRSPGQALRRWNQRRTLATAATQSDSIILNAPERKHMLEQSRVGADIEYDGSATMRFQRLYEWAHASYAPYDAQFLEAFRGQRFTVEHTGKSFNVVRQQDDMLSFHHALESAHDIQSIHKAVAKITYTGQIVSSDVALVLARCRELGNYRLGAVKFRELLEHRNMLQPIRAVLLRAVFQFAFGSMEMYEPERRQRLVKDVLLLYTERKHPFCDAACELVRKYLGNSFADALSKMDMGNVGAMRDPHEMCMWLISNYTDMSDELRSELLALINPAFLASDLQSLLCDALSSHTHDERRSEVVQGIQDVLRAAAMRSVSSRFLFKHRSTKYGEQNEHEEDQRLWLEICVACISPVITKELSQGNVADALRLTRHALSWDPANAVHMMNNHLEPAVRGCLDDTGAEAFIHEWRVQLANDVIQSFYDYQNPEEGLLQNKLQELSFDDGDVDLTEFSALVEKTRAWEHPSQWLLALERLRGWQDRWTQDTLPDFLQQTLSRMVMADVDVARSLLRLCVEELSNDRLPSFVEDLKKLVGKSAKLQPHYLSAFLAQYLHPSCHSLSPAFSLESTHTNTPKRLLAELYTDVLLRLVYSKWPVPEEYMRILKDTVTALKPFFRMERDARLHAVIAELGAVLKAVRERGNDVVSIASTNDKDSESHHKSRVFVSHDLLKTRAATLQEDLRALLLVSCAMPKSSWPDAADASLNSPYGAETLSAAAIGLFHDISDDNHCRHLARLMRTHLPDMERHADAAFNVELKQQLEKLELLIQEGFLWNHRDKEGFSVSVGMRARPKTQPTPEPEVVDDW